MKRKLIPILSLIGLMSFAVLGSSPNIIKNFIELIQNNPITNSFSTKVNSKSKKTTSEVNNKSKKSALEIKSYPNDDKIEDKHDVETPEHILWGVIFRQPEKYERIAEGARQKGKSDALWTDGFVSKTKLSLENAEIFKIKAMEYSKELLPVTERSREIGLQYKLARESGKRVREDLALRKEVSKLQEKRKELALKYRDEFHKAIHEEAFKAFEEWLKTEFVKNFYTKRITGKDIYKAKVESGEINPTEKNIPEDHHK